MTRVLTAVCFVAMVLGRAEGVESPTSYGPAAKVDTPILRIPMMKTPPTIDGVMAAGEWEDSSALSGFWYDYASAAFYFLAPIQTQLQVYAAYDKEHLYIVYRSPVYPANTWLKARGRFPDVTHHPLYGLIWDDHVELELRPYHDIAEGFRLGLFKWFINPIGTFSDQYWSVQGGEGKQWTSRARIRCGIDGEQWVIEAAIPLRSMVHGNYEGKDDAGAPLVKLPPPSGTTYRCWFTRGIGGNHTFFNVFDNHVWNTTKTKLIFDPAAVSFQVNELGPIMDDVIDLRLTVKNHNTRSETVRLGFFIENQQGLIYSSYEAPELKDGLLELVPGEVRKLRLRKPFPGISTDGNVLWFDVRTAARPAKVLFRTRLIRFHSMEGGAVQRGEQTLTFRTRRIDAIEKLRPPRKPFDFRYQVDRYSRRVAAVADIGIHGADPKAKTAREAKVAVMKDTPDEDIVAEATAPFTGDFACLRFPAPKLVNGESYKVLVLLFDENRRIVGDREEEPFVFETPAWQDNKLGLDDVVWEPFVPIATTTAGFDTLKHRFELAPSGLPAQIAIKPDPREVPLEKRAAGAELSRAGLLEMGRGPQLRAPMRLEAVVDGQRVPAKVRTKARLVRQWKSEHEYAAMLEAGPLGIDLRARYDCDGSLHASLTYGCEAPTRVDGLELVMDVAGLVDLALSAAHGGGMAGADVWECSLPDRQGVVWDSANVEKAELYYSHFIPWFWFGSADRAFSWYADSDEHWLIDRDGSTMTLERDAAGAVTWRVKFINHPVEVVGRRTVAFSLLVHPAKPKPPRWRWVAWLGRGGAWADEYPGGNLYKSDEDLLRKARLVARSLTGFDGTDAELLQWRKPDPPFWRFYQLRSMFPPPKGQGTPEMDREFEDKFTWHFERHVRIGRRHGWWWDETWPTYRSNNLASGNAYFRDPATVREGELPWQSCYLTGHMRRTFKRLARCFKTNNVPLRNYLWANNSATCMEAFAWDTMLVEECGSGHRSFEVDVVTQFPSSLYRYMCHNYTGLVARVVPDKPMALPGDDKRLDRQHLGRALLNDIGVSFEGPHGYFVHREQALRLINALADFGFFDDQGIEKIPFWRSAPYVRYGQEEPAPDVHVTVYRRVREGGRGTKALFVVMNESKGPVELPLTVVDPARVLGGPNTLKVSDIRARTRVPDALQVWWAQASQRNADAPALMDLETGEVVARIDGAAEAYGPLHVPVHDYRVLYGHWEE